VARNDLEKVKRMVRCYEIGRIVKGDRKVRLIG